MLYQKNMRKAVCGGDHPNPSLRMSAVPQFCAARALVSGTIADPVEASGLTRSASLRADRADGMPGIRAIDSATLRRAVDPAFMVLSDGTTVSSDGGRLCPA